MIFNRPWIVFVQFLAGLIFAVVFLIRFGVALSLWDFLSQLPLAVSPLYQVLSGLVWGMAGLWVCLWIWQGNPRAPQATRILSVTYALYYWIDQLLIMSSDLRQTNWLFLAIFTGILLVLVFLSFQPAAVKEFFGEEYEQEE